MLRQCETTSELTVYTIRAPYYIATLSYSQSHPGAENNLSLPSPHTRSCPSVNHTNHDYIFINHRPLSTFDHRSWKIGHPVRSAVLKPRTGCVVVVWVTNSEFQLSNVFGIFSVILISRFVKEICDGGSLHDFVFDFCSKEDAPKLDQVWERSDCLAEFCRGQKVVRRDSARCFIETE